jgi:hypothetical protein
MCARIKKELYYHPEPEPGTKSTVTSYLNLQRPAQDPRHDTSYDRYETWRSVGDGDEVCCEGSRASRSYMEGADIRNLRSQERGEGKQRVIEPVPQNGGG